MKNAKTVDSTWTASSVTQSDSSFIGPHIRNTRQIMVQLGHSVSLLRTLNSRYSFSLQGNVDGYINPVDVSTFGNLHI